MFKIGDKVRHVSCDPHEIGIVVEVRENNLYRIEWEDSDWGSTDHISDLVPVKDDGPVRKVTRREIVPGVYGRVEVEKHDTFPESILIKICDVRGAFHTMDADELREAAHILNQIAEALSDV